MKKLLTLTTALLHACLAFAQIKATIIDRETKEAVPFVNIWVENENLGTTADENGRFELKLTGTKKILFSAIGFEHLSIHSDSINNFVALKPLPVQLKEVVIVPKRGTQALSIGKFEKSRIDFYFACGTHPWVVARYFAYDELYEKTPFLSRIRVLTESDVKDAQFNIRLYSVGENGQPGDYIYDKNIIAVAKKGKKVTEIDIADLGITFPQNGFFLALEWLIIETNKHEYQYTEKDSNKKKTGITYEPAFGTIPDDSDQNSWIFSRGKCIRIWKNELSVIERYKNKYNLIAVELILTN